MAVAMGLDLSLTGTGYAVFYVPNATDEPGISGVIETKKARGVERLLHIEDRLERIIESFPPELVCLEGYAYMRSNQAHQAGELGGIIRRRLHKLEIPWLAVAPMTLKKFATGKGNIDKNLVHAFPVESFRAFACYKLTLLGENLARPRVGYGLRERFVCNPSRNRELFIVFITSDIR